MTWTKLPPVEGAVACLHCSGAGDHLHPERVIAVGFGDAGWTRDGDLLWSESVDADAIVDDSDYPTVARVEALAANDPDHDWRIFFHAPLYSAVYQRQGEGLWVLVEKGLGFA